MIKRFGKFLFVSGIIMVGCKKKAVILKLKLPNRMVDMVIKSLKRRRFSSISHIFPQ
jgi:hypothetical protein